MINIKINPEQKKCCPMLQTTSYCREKLKASVTPDS